MTLGLAVLVALRAVSPPPPAQHIAVVAAHDLAGGHDLGPDDLAVRQVPSGLLPSGSSDDVGALVGHTLAAPVRAGEVLTDRRVLGEGLLAAHPGSVAVPARLADPASRGLLSVGDTVDLVAASPHGRSAAVVASAVPVLALPSGGGAGGGGEPRGLVIVAVSSDDALRVAQASAAGVVGVVLLG